jgi:hypothetical protein
MPSWLSEGGTVEGNAWFNPLPKQAEFKEWFKFLFRYAVTLVKCHRSYSRLIRKRSGL